MNKSLVKVSIIIPVYNVEEYIDNCFNSILNQTFRDIEIILVDDGSTDKSGDICLRWQNKDSRIIYIKKKNEGQGIARNLGVRIAKGDYITFVDPDDWLEEDAIENMYNAAKKSNADIVLGDLNYVTTDEYGENKTTLSKLRIKENTLIYSKENTKLIDVCRMNLWGKLYKKEFYIDSGIKQPSHFYEDAAVIPLLVAKAETIYYIPKPVYNYFRSRSESTMNNLDNLSDLNKTLIETAEGFKRENLFDKYYNDLVKISYAQIRFLYRKFLGDSKELDIKYKLVIEKLYKFMGEVYPDWINIDKYTVGYSNDKRIELAVKNIVFNESRMKISKEVKEVVEDILVINLVDELYEKDKKLWIDKCNEDLVWLENNFKGKKIIAVNFVNNNLNNEDRENIDSIYTKYKESRLNISILNFNLNEEGFNENSSWDLADEILSELRKSMCK